MAAPEYKYIGADPVAWVRRLRDVNDGSAFPQPAKDLIDDTLSTLERSLANVDSVPKD